MNLWAMAAIGTASWPFESSSLDLTHTSASASNRANLYDAVNWPSFSKALDLRQEFDLLCGAWGHRLLLPVGCIIRYHPPHATPGVGHVAVPPGNDMHVGV